MNEQDQWEVSFRDWYVEGERLAASEEQGTVPDPDDYANYDDEAARLALWAATIFGIKVMVRP